MTPVADLAAVMAERALGRREAYVPEGVTPATEALAKIGGGDENPPMNDRLSKLEGSYDALKVARPMTIAVLSAIGAVIVGGMAILSAQMMALSGRVDAGFARIDTKFDRMDAKFDALSSKLSDEFRAQRAEMSAQTSAIANAITATRQQEPQASPVPKK